MAGINLTLGLEFRALSSVRVGCPRQAYWSRLLLPSPGDLPNPGIKPGSLTLAGRFFTTEPSGKLKERPIQLPDVLSNHFFKKIHL